MSALAVKLTEANVPGQGTVMSTTCSAVDDDCRKLADANNANNQAVANVRWDDLRKKLFELDEKLQDSLTAVSDTQACGYQLGRGLAEIYWSLNPDPTTHSEEEIPVTWNSWAFLLGKQRCEELTRLAGRLSAYFPQYTTPAVAGSLAAWHTISTTPDWRDAPGPQDDPTYLRDSFLYKQIRGWYQLVVLLQDPSTLIRPYAFIKNYRAVLRGLRAFLVQILGAIISLGFLSAFLIVLTQNQNVAWEKSLLGVVGILGVSFTAISSRIKNSAQSLLARIKADAYGDLVALNITVAPPRPPSFAQRAGIDRTREQRDLLQAIQGRGMTSANVSPD